MTENEQTQAGLADAQSEFSFKAIDGNEIRNIRGLANALGGMSDDSFHYHVNEGKNDFSRWVKDVFGEHELAESLSQQGSRLESENCVLRHLLGKFM